MPRTALADVLMKSARTVALSTPIAVAGLMAVAVPVSAQSVLKVVPHADLRNVDPIWTTAVTDSTRLAFALIAFALLRFASTPPWLLVLASAGAGALILH